MKSKLVKFLLVSSLAMASFSASAKEYPIGEPQIKEGMEIAAVYLQPITMDMEIGIKAKDADVHLEADIKAVEKNKWFPEDSWVPYLVVKYELTKQGGKTQTGEFHTMVANDGPHYGDNIKMQGPGKYKLKYTIYPPSANKSAHFMRHIDKETGVPEWFKPITVEWDFVFAGFGKKGGY